MPAGGESLILLRRVSNISAYLRVFLILICADFFIGLVPAQGRFTEEEKSLLSHAVEKYQDVRLVLWSFVLSPDSIVSRTSDIRDRNIQSTRRL